MRVVRLPARTHLPILFPPRSAGTLAYFGQHPEEIQLFVPDLQVRWRASQWDDAQVAQVRAARDRQSLPHA